MDDLISKKAAIEAFDRIPRIKGLGFELLISVSDAKDMLEGMKAVDAAPVTHGRWELVDEAEPQRYGCSKCSCLSWYGTYKYCPNCGAKMDLEK